ncbi:MAG: AI-2E family transporter [Thermoanaerobaculia bacterium]
MNSTLLLKFEKWAIWAGLIGIIYLLRHLFPIFFVTFVLAYIASSAVKELTRRFPRRKLNVVLVYVVLLAILAGALFLIVPRMISEARGLARQYIVTENVAGPAANDGVLQREAHQLLDAAIVFAAGEAAFVEFRQSDAYAAVVGRIDASIVASMPRIIRAITLFANHAVVFAFQFLLSILLSFLLVWDLPRTRERIARLGQGPTAEVYAEVAPSIRAFGIMLGRAFEAQSVVAVVNALLSVLVFVILGLPSIALLATIVFVCSYIPIIGMILSTIPAALLAFKVGGIAKVLWLILLVLVIHAVEAYMLNPLIYGRHLRLHPVAVIVILLVAEHLFGLWGLLLGVPVAAFFIKYGIEGEDVAQPPPDAVRRRTRETPLPEGTSSAEAPPR